MATTPADTARPARLAQRSTPLLIAGMLFAGALLILVWPVSTNLAYDGQSTPKGGTARNVCGMTISQAFRTPTGPQDPQFARTLDCASRARDRLGYAVLFLLFAVPPAVLALDDSARRRA